MFLIQVGELTLGLVHPGSGRLKYNHSRKAATAINTMQASPVCEWYDMLHCY